MFEPEDFQLTLEAQLNKRMIEDEVNNCESIEVLRASLLATNTALMTQQQLIKSLLKKQLAIEVSNLVKQRCQINNVMATAFTRDYNQFNPDPVLGPNTWVLNSAGANPGGGGGNTGPSTVATAVPIQGDGSLASPVTVTVLDEGNYV